MFINSVYASETSAEVQAQAPVSNMELFQNNFMSFVPMLLIFAVFYFLLIRPQDQKRKEHEKLVGSVQKGEDVLTHSGIYGRVERINEADSSVDLEIAKGVVVKVSKVSISDILNRKEKK
jgi:preprotein translocase subunit YajC